MAEGKVTIMKLKVDLQCCKCYKKVKKVLCKFPQIRHQVFDEKQGIVTIKVVCCDPEKLRDKLCCKGEGCIKSIEIVEPPPPPPRTKTQTPPSTPPRTKTPTPPRTPPRTKTPTPPRTPPKTPPPCCGPCSERRPGGPCYEGRQPFGVCCGPCSEGLLGGPCYEGGPTFGECCGPCSEGHSGGPCYKRRPLVGPCCGPCSEGRPGGPCYQGFGRRPICYDRYYGWPVCDSYGEGWPCYVSRCDQSYYDENPQGCTVM